MGDAFGRGECPFLNAAGGGTRRAEVNDLSFHNSRECARMRWSGFRARGQDPVAPEYGD